MRSNKKQEKLVKEKILNFVRQENTIFMESKKVFSSFLEELEEKKSTEEISFKLKRKIIIISQQILDYFEEIFYFNKRKIVEKVKTRDHFIIGLYEKVKSLIYYILEYSRENFNESYRCHKDFCKGFINAHQLI